MFSVFEEYSRVHRLLKNSPLGTALKGCLLLADTGTLLAFAGSERMK